MPTYQYECTECKHQMDNVMQSIKDEPYRICPACNQDTLTRVIGLTSFVLQGSGWAKDLYSSAGNKK